MPAAGQIRQAVAEVAELRAACAVRPELRSAVLVVKGLQSRRFRGSYADLLVDARFQAAARFFLDELYSDRDYAARDAQFARVAGTLQRVFPAHVTRTAVSLALLHALTEQLDHQMALAWLQESDRDSETTRYIRCWSTVGQAGARREQLSAVLGIGRELIRLTAMPGLRMMLRMMRGPAGAAGLGALQGFLESGFDTFAGMSRGTNAANQFLTMIDERESAWIAMLCSSDHVTSETEFQRVLVQRHVNNET